MSKEDTGALRKNAATATNNATTYGTNAQSTFNVLTPTLNRLATGGGGYTPIQMAGFKTAALDTTGGATAGTVGGILQRAATTNNAGGGQAGAIAAAHDATAGLTDAALGVQNQSAQLAAQQQSQALAEQGQIYGTSAGAEGNELGLSTQATNAAETASQNGFLRTVAGRLLDPASYAGLVKPR